MMELGAGKKRTSIQLNLATISQIRMNAIGDAICTTLSLTEFSIKHLPDLSIKWAAMQPTAPCSCGSFRFPASFTSFWEQIGSENCLGASLSNLVRRDLIGLLVRGLTAEDADVTHRSIEIRNDEQMNNIDRRDSKIRLPGSAI